MAFLLINKSEDAMSQWGASPVGKTATALAARRVKKGLICLQIIGLNAPDTSMETIHAACKRNAD